MNENGITLEYDAEHQCAVLTFRNGRKLKLANVSEDKAHEFLERHAPEFQKRDCCLATVDGQFTRGDKHGKG